MRQQAEMRYIYKIHSSVLKRNKWNLTLTIEEAQRNGQLISLANSQLIDFIDDIMDKTIKKQCISIIRKQIKKIQSSPISLVNKDKIQDLYLQKNEVLFIDGYVEIVMDTKKDFDILCSDKKDCIINGKKYRRLLGTTGGIKKSTVMFVSDNLHKRLNELLNCGRNEKVKLIPAKLEAYKALSCSSSVKVTPPKGVLVVKDIETTFNEDVITIKSSDISNRPDMYLEENKEITINPCDGCGMISPLLSQRWAETLTDGKVKEPLSGYCVRNAFLKGMLFTFDFQEWAGQYADDYIVTDIWGNDIDVRDVDIVITDNMLKLWDSYDNVLDYLDKCKKAKYSFRVTKYCEPKLENERNLNYQFINGYELSNEEIQELIAPTVNEILDVMGGDYRKSLLFLKGIHMTDNNAFNKDKDTDIVKALMAEPKMIYDDFVKNKIHNAIKKKIRLAKLGVLKIEGCYSIISGDLFALCQWMFGMKVTGLLNSGEYYARYWLDKKVHDIVAYRAPMSVSNNIRKFHIIENDKINYWFRYMKTCIVLNSSDTTTIAMNGCDFDADAIITTNNSILLHNTPYLNAISCEQKKGEKKRVTEKQLIKANKVGFGDDVGSITNKVTAMYERRAGFDKDSKEYKELDYRIKCGQHFQQLAIDKAKGIVSSPMPQEWYSYKVNKINKYDNEKIKEEKLFNLSILADKKPYFFIYRYPKLKAEYLQFINDIEDKCLMQFRTDFKVVLAKEDKSEEEKALIEYYNKFSPVGNNDCVMNKICHAIEDIFDNTDLTLPNEPFDYNILKTDIQYTKKEYSDIEKIYKEYKKNIRQYNQSRNNNEEKDERNKQRELFRSIFKEKAYMACNNAKKLCNIVLDMCYTNKNSKQFAWDICGDVIIDNLLEKHDNIVSYPIQDNDGDIDFGGYKFKMSSRIINETDKEEI